MSRELTQAQKDRKPGHYWTWYGECSGGSGWDVEQWTGHAWFFPGSDEPGYEDPVKIIGPLEPPE